MARTRLRIAELAQERGWSRNKLSEQAKVDRKAIPAYWNNTIKRPDLDVLERFADAFGVSVKDLIADNESADAEKA
jgi:transcriptional regulator with XRE-family HTH domain